MYSFFVHSLYYNYYSCVAIEHLGKNSVPSSKLTMSYYNYITQAYVHTYIAIYIRSNTTVLLLLKVIIFKIGFRIRRGHWGWRVKWE